MNDAARPPRMDDMRLLPVGLAAWCGAWCGTESYAMFFWAMVVAILGLCCGVVLIVLKESAPAPRHSLAPAGSLAAAILICAISAAAATTIGGIQRSALERSAVYEARGKDVLLTVTARLTEDPIGQQSRFGQARSRAKARVLSVQSSGSAERALSSQVYLVLKGATLDSFHRGDVVRVRGVVAQSALSAPPVVGTLCDDTVELIERPALWHSAIRRIRADLVAAAAHLDAQGRALVPGMAIGDDRAMERELKEAFRTTSLAHLTAVSGSHIAIVLGVVPFLLPNRRLVKLLGMGGILTVFVAIVGPTPAVLRAACSCGVALIGAIIGRGGQGVATLAAVVTAMILIDPWCSRDFGFALSVAATFGILIPARAWMRAGDLRLRDDTFAGRLMRRASGVVAVPMWCALATAPILSLMNPALPTYAVVANIIASPAVAPATLMGLAAAICAPWWMDAGRFFAGLASVATRWVAGTAQFFAALPGARFHPKTWHIAIILAAAGVTTYMYVRHRRGRLGGAAHSRRTTCEEE